MLQEEGEEVAVEVAVKDLQPNGPCEEAAGLEGSWEQAGSRLGSAESKSRLSPHVPPHGTCQNKTQHQIPVAHLILLKGRRND